MFGCCGCQCCWRLTCRLRVSGPGAVLPVPVLRVKLRWVGARARGTALGEVTAVGCASRASL